MSLSAINEHIRSPGTPFNSSTHINTIFYKLSIKIEALVLFLIPDSNLTPPNMIHISGMTI